MASTRLRPTGSEHVTIAVVTQAVARHYSSTYEPLEYSFLTTRLK